MRTARGLVCNDAQQVEIIVAQLVRPRQRGRCQHRRLDLGPERARDSEVGDDPVSNRQQGPVFLNGTIDVVHLLPLMPCGQHVLVPVLVPFHGPSEPHREDYDRYLVLEDGRLDPEPPADVWGDYANPVLRVIQNLCQECPEDVRELC